MFSQTRTCQNVSTRESMLHIFWNKENSLRKTKYEWIHTKLTHLAQLIPFSWTKHKPLKCAYFSYHYFLCFKNCFINNMSNNDDCNRWYYSCLSDSFARTHLKRCVFPYKRYEFEIVIYNFRVNFSSNGQNAYRNQVGRSVCFTYLC